ncbi:MAG: AAA family ATPase, partial [Deltaproteobacteria bacterium]|nr:AAA family ATPase [Deltaproteobacteria bacterium]
MWINRYIFKLVRSAFQQFPALIITGPRQTGKTAGVKYLFPDAAYVSLDFLDEARRAQEDPKGFLSRFHEPLIIDEIQYAPDFLRYLKGVIDQDRRPGRFIITGSQPFQLMEGVTESLSGRAAIIRMPTLMTAEILA